jgi:preprotein translocase subunit Sec61beta
MRVIDTRAHGKRVSRWSGSHTVRKVLVPSEWCRGMSSGQNSGGLMSSAGLVRYFDAEDRNAIRLDPRSVVAFGALFGVGVQVLNVVAL